MERAKQINSLENLEEALTESNDRPVLVFKHSLSCSISAMASRQFDNFLVNPIPGVSYKIITVQNAREASDEFSSRLGIKHETPQMVLVRNGKCVWQASHYFIKPANIEKAIRAELEKQ